MKTKRYITLIATASILMLAGCNSLEQPPVNQFTDANYWTAERAQYMINTAYSQMYSASRMWEDESMSDNVINQRSTNNGGRLLQTGQANSDTDLFNNEWDSMYAGIKSCHTFLDNVQNIQMDANLLKRNIAEVQFIRCYLYFRLATLYGDVPYYEQDITSSVALETGKTPKNEIISAIRAKLEEIIPDLPSRDQLPKAENGRITKGAAVMLLARTYLYENDWTNVEKYTRMLIDEQSTYGTYSLFNSYRGLFEEANEYNQEVILDRSYIPNLNTWDQIQDMIPLSRNGRVSDRVPVQALVDSYLTLNGRAIDEAGSGYRADDPYKDRDPRLTATIIYDGYDWDANVNNWFEGKGKIQINPATSTTEDKYTGPNANTSATGYYIRKWYSPQDKGSASSGLNIIMMRYADVLLMYAEALNEQNKFDASAWDKTIKAIRQRAGFTNSYALDFPSGKSQAELREIIRNERRVELAIEGLRFFDIKSWDIGAKVFSGEVKGAWFTDKIGIVLKHVPERNYQWAIPQSEIDLNPNLKPQNPGY